ncbi:hypothetical protein ES703_23977 [subsurface metagenome]
MVVIGIIVLIIIAIIFGKKFVKPKPLEPVPDPDPHYHKWPLIDKTTERWKNYCNYMKKITSDTLVALELKFYKWISDWDLWNKLDHWALPDVVWVNKKDDCDGLSRLVADILGRFVKIAEVWWLEYYGFFREYYQKDGKWLYRIKAGGHAICVYKKDGKLLAFSNTTWWNTQNFQCFIEIGELTFPEGLYLVICRHWETGKMEWQLKAKEGEILVGTNIFHRKLRKIINLIGLRKGELKEMKKHA